jgi:glycerate kinase
MRVVVAPDKFKGSLTAAQAAAAIASGLRQGKPDLDVVELPVADGGDGTVAAALAAGFAAVQVTATGPTGEPVLATFARSEATAVIELAEVTGLRQLPGGRLAPLTASTYGVGEVIAAALDAGATTIVLGIGGSSSTDGGAGMVTALGARLAGADGRPVARGGAGLVRLAGVDTSGVDPRLARARVLVACDVDNPLLGPSGAAAVFGPQKGATASDIVLLDQALARWAALTTSVTGRDLAGAAGAGAAGGTGFAALAYLGARLVPGIDLVLDLIGFDAAVAGADLVITGEGSLDRQTLGGKAPFGVARAAARRDVPVIVIAGRILLSAAELGVAGFSVAYDLVDLEPDHAASMAAAWDLLEQVGRQIASGPLVSGLAT